ncbi:MAG: HPr family phosphocarrier protein [Chloroflexota bacterium]
MATDIELTVTNPAGLHARPAATFVRAAAGFASGIQITNLTTGSGPASAKSLIGVLSIGALIGHTIRLTCDGTDAAEAADVLGGLVSSGLGEHASGG